MNLMGSIAALLVAPLLSACALSPGPCGPPTENVTWAKQPAMLRPITYWRRVERSAVELKAACNQEQHADVQAAAWGVCYNAYVLRNYLGSIHSLSRKPYIAKLAAVISTTTEIKDTSLPESCAPSQLNEMDILIAGIATDAPEIFQSSIERPTLARGSARSAGRAR